LAEDKGERMKIVENSINPNLIAVKPVIFEKKSSIVLLKDDKKYMVGKVNDTEEYCIFPKGAGYKVEDVMIIAKGDILAMVEPSDGENVVDYYDYKTPLSADAEWVNVVNTVGKGSIL